MSREYDIRLLNILNSYNNVSKLAEVIILLKHEYVLNSDELELCDKCLSDIESYNGSNLSKILNLDANIERYDILKVENVIDEFICDRRRCEVNDIFSLEFRKCIAPDTIGKLLKAYDRRITSSIDSNIFDEDIFMNQTDDVDISSVSNSIDSFSKG